MTAPKLANLSLWGEANAFAEARAYRDPRTGLHYPSVTSILKLMPKALEQYAASEQLKWDIAHWQDLSRKSDEQAFKSYRFMWRNHADLRGHVGDGIHNYIEAEQTGSWEFPELDEEQEAILANWHELNEVHEIVPIKNEVTVGDVELGWMGTVDSYCLFDGAPALVDFKTSRVIRESAHIQLSALTMASEWFVEVEDMKWEVEPAANFPIEKVLVFHLRADSWAIHEVNNVPAYYDKFKHYLEIWKLNESIKAANKEAGRDTPD
jgi:hypothetical protein